ncbi:MAG: CoA transferase [Pseudomonadota bacterium]
MDTLLKPPPLQGVSVLDFSTLLPGPLCSLLLADAGAKVLKVERPGGDEMRSYEPKFGPDSAVFGLLNRGKDSVTLDLKGPDGQQRARELALQADVLVEQFRPGVMARLGLDYESLRDDNPRLIYCSITGFGQAGPLAGQAAHDLNFLAESGMLSLCTDAEGKPPLPPALIGDIGGGTYPAVMNILLALRQREATGEGCHLDVAMADNLFTFSAWALGRGWANGRWPQPGGEYVTGGTPRYQIYRTLDGGHLAAAPLEQRFWATFLQVLGAPELLDDGADPAETTRRVAGIISLKTRADWERRFTGIDACVSVVRTLQEAVDHPHFRARGLFTRQLAWGGTTMPALHTPVAEGLRAAGDKQGYPPLHSPQAHLER